MGIRPTRESIFALLPANFPKGHAGYFTPVSSAGDANMSMSALNAEENIRQVNARSHQPTSAPMSENPDHNLLIQVLDSLPVTPVKADRFENLLAGYSPAMHKNPIS